MSVVGNWPFGSTQAVVLSDTLAYTLNGNAIEAIDTTSTPLQRIGTLALPVPPVAGIVADSGMLVAALGSYGLALIDIADPQTPTLMGMYPVAAEQIEIVGEHILALHGSALLVISIADQERPAEVGRIDLGELTTKLEVEGEKIFVGTISGAVHLISISTDSQPNLLGNWTRPEGTAPIEDIAVSGTVMLVVHGPEGLSIVDVSDAANPQTATTFADRERGEAMVAVGLNSQNAFVGIAGAESGVLSLDMSNPALPRPVSFSPLETGVRDLHATTNSIVLVTDHGIARVLLDESGSLAATDYYPTPGEAAEVVSVGPFAYVGAASGVFSVNLDEAQNPRTTSVWNTDGAVLALSKDGNRLAALLAQNGGVSLAMADISAPASPVYVGQTEPLPVGAVVDGSVVLKGDSAFAAVGAGGLLIFSTPRGSMPTLQAFDSGVDARGVALEGEQLFVSESGQANALAIYSVSDPVNPVRTNSIVLGGVPGALTLLRGLAFVNVGGGLTIVDVNDPANLRIVGQFDRGSAERHLDIGVEGETIFVTDQVTGLVRAYGISTPTLPNLQWIISASPTPISVALAGGRLLVLDEVQGLTIFD